MNIGTAKLREQGASSSAGKGKQRAPRFSGPVAQAKARQRLNRWEQQYRDALDVQKRAGLIADYYSQAVKLRLADNTSYLPDFLIVQNDGRLKFVEVKGFKRQAGLIKFKIAKERYAAMADFEMVTRTGDGWLVI